MGAVPLADFNKHTAKDADVFDFVVVGAGTAGCLITKGLSNSVANPAASGRDSTDDVVGLPTGIP